MGSLLGAGRAERPSRCRARFPSIAFGAFRAGPKGYVVLQLGNSVSLSVTAAGNKLGRGFSFRGFKMIEAIYAESGVAWFAFLFGVFRG